MRGRKILNGVAREEVARGVDFSIYILLRMSTTAIRTPPCRPKSMGTLEPATSVASALYSPLVSQQHASIT
ncbi:hypothetical protein DN392_18380 [Bacillus sp. BB51/4]|nr:hypothetical protein DN392_18380 [Bacillus sp. BB51/4]